MTPIPAAPRTYDEVTADLAALSEAYRALTKQKIALELEAATVLAAESGLLGCVIEWPEKRGWGLNARTVHHRMLVRKITYYGVACGPAVTASGKVGTAHRTRRVYGEHKQPFTNLGKPA